MNTTETAKPHQWIAWTGTAILLIAATMASFNLYPWYSYAFCLANAIWVLVGILWKEKSLIVLNAGLTVIYIVGIIENFIAQ
jgi:hypothetical protein